MSFRVLFLCTGNSVRSQMAEALLNHRGQGRFRAESAGTVPARAVHPRAIEALRRGGIAWEGHGPRRLDGLEHEPWDLVVTVCDDAKEACPVFPSRSIVAHWGMPAPIDVVGRDEEQQRAFDVAFATLSHRIDQLVALPVEEMDRSVLEQRVRTIGKGTGLGVRGSGFGSKP
jgi:protein-tyrosine-phosphatase